MAQSATNAERSLYVHSNQSTTSIHSQNNALELGEINISKEKLNLSINLTPAFTKHFILVKGLLEFHRPKEFRFSYVKENNTVAVQILSSEIAAFKKFVRFVNDLVIKELAFRKALKRVIAFEEQQKAAARNIYRDLLYS